MTRPTSKVPDKITKETMDTQITTAVYVPKEPPKPVVYAVGDVVVYKKKLEFIIY